MRTFEEVQDELRECINHAYRDECEDIEKFGGNTQHLDNAMHRLNELIEIHKGEWISTEDRPEGFCSKCDRDIAEEPTPYCPYCGAKMTWVGAIHDPYQKGGEEK